MRSDLGRLDAIAEILQVGSFLGRMGRPLASPGARLALRAARWYIAGKDREYPMKAIRVAAVFALLVSPAYAQIPNINLIPELPSKTQDEKDADAVKDRAYKDSLRKIPDAKASSDPWGNVRSGDAPKDTSRTAAPAKPRTKTGTAN
jgi:hypothetical protein